MLTYISADQIYPVDAPPIEKGVLGVEADGTIKIVLSPQKALELNILPEVHYNGVIVPGLVNTHCHLELSHLRGEIPMHTGLPEFVQQVIRHRSTETATIVAAMKQADEEMYANGIVAVGDISNQLVSRSVKLESKIYYHTFVEAMGFNPARAGAIMAAAVQTKKEFNPLKASVVPHAPYSVSEELFKEIYNHALENEDLGSMHNQETDAENSFFKDKSGDFLGLYQFLGLDISFFNPSGKSSLQTVLPLLSPQKMLLVHNTVSDREDLAFANKHHANLYWCLCPNANLYIENRLPDVELLVDGGVKLTLGTDSLASNQELCILSEMRVLQQHKAIGFDDLLRWATINGADFLGISEQFGTLAVGKRPGINLIEHLEDGIITNKTTIRRLF